MTTVLPLSAFCTIIRRIFNASNSAFGKFFSKVLPVSLHDEKAESMSLLLINSLSKLETSKKSTALYSSSKGSTLLRTPSHLQKNFKVLIQNL